MPSFTYRGDPRVYPDLGLEVTDGDVVDLAEAPPDGRWSTTPSAATTPPAEPSAAPPQPDPTPKD